MFSESREEIKSNRMNASNEKGAAYWETDVITAADNGSGSTHVRACARVSGRAGLRLSMLSARTRAISASHC